MNELTRRLFRRKQGALGAAILLVVAFACILGPWLAPYDPDHMDLMGRFAAPGVRHLLGADQFGRDELSRLLYGARDTVPAAVLATLAGTLAGAIVGTLSAYVGGRWDEAAMRTVDAVMAIPGLLLALLIAATLGAGEQSALLAIAIAFAPGMARITRSVALAARQEEYVAAAIARGEAAVRIVVAEMLPNVIAPVVVESTIRVAFAVMVLATLSFLGLGAQPPSAAWGLLVSDGRAYLHDAPWLVIAPGVAIGLTAIGFNLLGDGLRDALNPRDER